MMRWHAMAAAWAVVGAVSGTAWAGGGPENVLLIVNRDSADSRTIANHYQAWRKIPPGNVVTIPWPENKQTTDIDTFRQKILRVALEEINRRRLASQIDYLVYSSGFPTAVNLKADKEVFLAAMQKDAPEGKSVEWPDPPLTTTGAITGLSYLWQPVMARANGYLDLHSNFYMRRDVSEQKGYETLGFSGRLNFDAKGSVVQQRGRRYLLSTMLGVTAGRGNTLDEILFYLERAVKSDGTHPKGTIYFAQNKDIRSTVRDSLFPAAVRDLKALGVNAEVVNGILPIGKNDVQGAMVGAASFDWPSSKSTILPGALCEHFTSFGGVMTGGGQTPLSEWLRYGAAGSSGTVVEPYALIDKFPVPAIQVHYARGCSLAEAYYQSVFGPYQLLIVGDPLCQPWARIPQVKVDGVSPGQKVSGSLELRPSATVPGGGIHHFELFIDEIRYSACLEGDVLKFDTSLVTDGWHEARVVAVESSRIQSQGRAIFPIIVDNRHRTIEASLAPGGKVTASTALTVTARSPGSIGILVLHNGQVMGRINGESGQATFVAGAMGRGPVTLRVVGMGSAANDYVWGEPIDVTIE